MNKEQESARKIILETNDNIFITGKAGTGKTTFLRQIIKELSAKRKKYVVLAPTGVAAINAEGSTIHRFFCWKPENKPLTNDKVPIETYQKLNTIIIDEASMLKADLLDRIDLFLKNNIKNKERENIPFAGVQMVFIGDLYQLPPVVADDKEQEKYSKDMVETDDEIIDMINDESKHRKYDSTCFLSSYALRKKYLHIIEFTEIFRQKDKQFIDILNSIRINNISQEQLNVLNKQSVNNNNTNSQIKLVTTNKKADEYNSFKLAKINSSEYISKAKIEPEDGYYSMPVPKVLKLKVGAKVMLLTNDPNQKYVNGSIGKIVNIQTELWTKKNISLVKKLTIQLNKGNIVEIERTKWSKYKYVWNKEKQEYEKVEVGYIEQFPIKLAWAVTIHKSQGQTFDTLTIDLGTGAFATRQVYVALSRCRSLSGISLIKEIQAKDVMIDTKIEKLLALQNKLKMEKLSQ
ncbi:ATP-dependent DNA helicase [Candidatus Ruminimicrobium bovinum]|uniref:ATP-dependent DNA helicase n=1 Tax=Candidatus Ruminimicrobium bovinum TaxID=3242779 RepID=UPI0039B8BAE9